MAFCRVAGLVAATVGTVVIAAAPAQAATAFTVKGTQTDHPAPYPEQLLPKLFANDSVTRIDYPATILGMDASIAVATAGIVNAVQNAVGPVVVAGFSQGAVAVAHAKQVLMSLPSRPSPANLSFITVGDPAGHLEHAAVERAQHDGHIDGPEHGGHDGGIERVELALMADRLHVRGEQVGPDGAHHVGHAGQRAIGRSREP